jgi:hypothetical protein
VSKSELVRVIRDAGRTPVERDALYRVVRRYEALGSGAASGRPADASAPQGAASGGAPAGGAA